MKKKTALFRIFADKPPMLANGLVQNINYGWVKTCARVICLTLSMPMADICTSLIKLANNLDLSSNLFANDIFIYISKNPLHLFVTKKHQSEPFLRGSQRV